MRNHWITLASLALLVACGNRVNNDVDAATGGGDDDSVVGESMALTSDTSSAESALAQAAAEGAGAAITADAAAAAAAMNVNTYLPNCATATAMGNTVTYTFTNCTGPYGFVKANGTVKVVFAGTVGARAMTVTASDFKVYESTFTLDVAAALTGDLTTPTLTVTSKSSATSAKGRTISRTGSYNASWDASCFTFTGSFETKVGLKTYTTTFANFKRCKTGCPSGTVTFNSALVNMSLVYSGGATALLTVGAKTYNVAVVCL